MADLAPSKPTFHACYGEIDRQVRAAAKRYGAGRDTDDIAQEATFRIAAKWDSYDPGQSLKGWVWQFTRRVCADFRGKACNREVSSEDGIADGADEQPDPEEHAQRAERRALLIELLRPMDEDRRIIFELKLLDEFSGTEIAEMLSIPLDTVFSRLRAARAELDERLARHRKAQGSTGLLGVVGIDELTRAAAAQMTPLDDVPYHANPPSDGATLPVGPPPVAPAAGGLGAAGALAKVAIPISAMRLASAGAVLFALGAGAGATGHAWMNRPQERPAAPIVAASIAAAKQTVSAVDTAAPSAAPPPPADTAPVVIATSKSGAGPSVPVLPSGGAKSPSSPNDTSKEATSAIAVASAAPLATATAATAAPSASSAAPPSVPKDERLLLDKASIALQNGEFAVAREALTRHARELPTSKWAGRRQELWNQLKQMEAKEDHP